MNVRRRKMLTRSILHWWREAVASRGYVRARAHANACAIAKLHPDWWVGGINGHPLLVRITYRGPRGGKRSRAYYLNGRVGAER